MIYLICLFSASSIDAKLILKIILNDGNTPDDPNIYCNNDDVQKMMHILDADEIAGVDETYYEERRRFLRSDILSNVSKHGTRILPKKYPAKCQENCMGYATGTCIAKNCEGYRRDKYDRGLLNTHDQNLLCEDGLYQFNQEIDALVPHLSSSCQPIVESLRSVSCFDDVRYAQIESFTFWNADTDTIIKENVQNGASICSRNYVNIEAVANACVEKVTFYLDGPVSTYNEVYGVGPYTVFGTKSDVDYIGTRLPVGYYT
jgi:hypothetical protein